MPNKKQTEDTGSTCCLPSSMKAELLSFLGCNVKLEGIIDQPHGSNTRYVYLSLSFLRRHVWPTRV